MSKNERILLWSIVIIVSLFSLYQYSVNEMRDRSKNWTREQLETFTEQNPNEYYDNYQWR